MFLCSHMIRLICLFKIHLFVHSFFLPFLLDVLKCVNFVYSFKEQFLSFVGIHILQDRVLRKYFLNRPLLAQELLLNYNRKLELHKTKVLWMTKLTVRQKTIESGQQYFSGLFLIEDIYSEYIKISKTKKQNKKRVKNETIINGL